MKNWSQAFAFKFNLYRYTQALWMHEELKKGEKYFASFLAHLRGQLEKLERQPKVEDVVASDGTFGASSNGESRLRPLVAVAMRAHRQVNLLTGAIAALTDQCPWLTRMAEVPEVGLYKLNPVYL
jgi:hypothetical protein